MTMGSEPTQCREWTNMTIGQTIYQQLGGKAFSIVTGANTFLGVEKGLVFRIPGKSGYAKNNINKVEIMLTPMDTYRVKFFRVRKKEGVPVSKLIAEVDSVYFDQLIDVFEEHTGLVARMPRFVRA
jgi:hypothetical protein